MGVDDGDICDGVKGTQLEGLQATKKKPRGRPRKTAKTTAGGSAGSD